MSARANWFVEQTVPLDDEPDPFSMPVEEVGDRIDLRDPQATLSIRLTELLQREGRLFDQNITCSIKDRRDTICHVCPVSKAHDREDPKGTLCRLGREQESVVMELAVLQCQAQ